MSCINVLDFSLLWRPIKRVETCEIYVPLQILLLGYAYLSVSSGQAPGDDDELCSVNDTSPANNVRNLMDSHKYINLLPGESTIPGAAVWNQMSVDGDLDASYPSYVSFLTTIICMSY